MCSHTLDLQGGSGGVKMSRKEKTGQSSSSWNLSVQPRPAAAADSHQNGSPFFKNEMK